MVAWIIEGTDNKGTWWVGNGVTVARSIEEAMRFVRKDIAEVYASAVGAVAYQVVF